MNPEQEIQLLENLVNELLAAIQEALQSGEVLSDEFQGAIADELEHATNRIAQIKSQTAQETQPETQQPFQVQPGPPQPSPQIEGAPPSPDAQLLWILAGQQEDAFIEYLKTFPTPATQSLLNNPSELERVIQFLHNMMPSGKQPIVDGIQHSDLNSSNIWGTSYDPRTKKMKVRFQGGAIYEYDNVPTNIYRAFTNGNASAKTKGSNKYGAWWVGKNPSMGAAMNQYIKAGGFNYRRLI